MSRSSPALTFISLDPPYRLNFGQETFVFLGWAEVDDEAAPHLGMTLNGIVRLRKGLHAVGLFRSEV